MGKLTEGESSIAVIGRGRVGKSLLIDKLISPRVIDETRTENINLKPLSKKLRIFPAGRELVIKIASIENELVKPEVTTKKCLMAVSESDCTLVVLDTRFQLTDSETYLISHLVNRKIPFLIAINKIEFGTNPNLLTELDALEAVYFEISCKENAGIESLKKKLIHLLPSK